MGYDGTVAITSESSKSATLGVTTEQHSPKHTYNKTFTDGTVIDKAEDTCSVDGLLTNAAPKTWDLNGGSSGDNDCDGLEGIITFTEITQIMVKNKSVTVGEIITIGNLAANAFDACWGELDTGQNVVPPGGCVILVNPSAAGWTVDATHKFLQLEVAAGTDVPFEMKIDGRIN